MKHFHLFFPFSPWIILSQAFFLWGIFSGGFEIYLPKIDLKNIFCILQGPRPGHFHCLPLFILAVSCKNCKSILPLSMAHFVSNAHSNAHMIKTQPSSTSSLFLLLHSIEKWWKNCRVHTHKDCKKLRSDDWWKIMDVNGNAKARKIAPLRKKIFIHSFAPLFTKKVIY